MNKGIDPLHITNTFHVESITGMAMLSRDSKMLIIPWLWAETSPEFIDQIRSTVDKYQEQNAWFQWQLRPAFPGHLYLACTHEHCIPPFSIDIDMRRQGWQAPLAHIADHGTFFFIPEKPPEVIGTLEQLKVAKLKILKVLDD